MNEPQDIALSQFCQAAQSSDYCFYIVYFGTDSSDSKPSVCACGISNDFFEALKGIRHQKQEIETEAFLYFCKDELVTRQVFDRFTHFLRYEHTPLNEAANNNSYDGYIWIDTNFQYLDRAFFSSQSWFENNTFRFAQTAFIRDAFEEHSLREYGNKRFLYPSLAVRTL